MTHSLLRYALSILVGLAIALPILGARPLLLTQPAHAQETGYSEEYRENNLQSTDLSTVSGIVRVIIGMISIIFVITIIMGAVKLSTCSGNNERQGEAYGMMAVGGIGLGVMVTIYIIAIYVIQALNGTNL